MKKLALLTLTSSLAIPFVLSVTSAGVARADDDDRKRELINKLTTFDFVVYNFEFQDGINAEPGFAAEAAACTAIVDQLKDLGVPPTEVLYGKKEFLFRKAPEKCERYGKIRTLVLTFPKIKEATQSASQLGDAKPGESGATRFAGNMVTTGAACVATINDAEAKGAPMDVAIKHVFYGKDLTAAEVRTWCEEAGKKAAALQGASAGADADKKKAARERYTKHGAAGDKLEWLLHYDQEGKGSEWYLSGCKTSSDPKTLAKAKVLIVWMVASVNGDGSHSLRKLTFKGNKLVKDQEKSWPAHEKSKAYSFCK